MNREPKRFFEFDAFRIDVAERQLLRENEPVLLTPKVFDILLALVENNGHTIEKDELIDRVWAETFVEDGNLNRNISTLRKVLGEDSHQPRLIRTVPKRGYRFVGDVREFLEKDEESIVETRTNYRLAVTEKIETQRYRRSIFSPRFLIIALSGAALLIFGSVWAVNRAQKNEVSSFSAAGVRQNRGTESDEAFELHQRGRALWKNRSVEGLHQATVYFEQAIEHDPNFALAHAGLADAYAFDVRLWVKAEGAAKEAIRLDPNLGEPHATIGFVRMFWEWKLSEAEPYFKKAIELSPNYATAHQWYAINLAARMEGGSSIAGMQRALELEPESLAINADMCQVLYFSRKYDQAIEQCRKTLEMDANFLNAHFYLYEIYTANEMYREAVNEYFKTEELNMTSQYYPPQLKALRRVYGTGGIRAFWRARIEMLKKQVPPGAYQIAQYYARLDEEDEAERWFRLAFDNRDFRYVFFISDPTNAEQLTYPRYLELSGLLMNRGVKGY